MQEAGAALRGLPGASSRTDLSREAGLHTWTCMLGTSGGWRRGRTGRRVSVPPPSCSDVGRALADAPHWSDAGSLGFSLLRGSGASRHSVLRRFGVQGLTSWFEEADGGQAGSDISAMLAPSSIPSSGSPATFLPAQPTRRGSGSGP